MLDHPRIVKRICTVPEDFGMSSKRRSNWSSEEEQALFSLLKTDTSMQTILDRFPNKSEKAIKTKIYKMGFTTKER